MEHQLGAEGRRSGDQRVEDPHAEAARQVQTGALDDHRNYRRQLAVGIVGWLLVPVLIAWLVADAGREELHVTLFLVTVAVVIALFSSSLAIDLFRPALIRSRRRALEPAEPNRGVDALGRPMLSDGARNLGGEFTIVERDGVRSYQAERDGA